MINNIELKKMIISGKDIDVDSIYEFFLQENKDAFEFACDQKFDDGCDSLMDSYEGWIYEMSEEDGETEKFLDKTRDDMSECFSGALS